MADEREQMQEQKYFERLNISVLSISKIKQIIKDDIKRTIKAWDSGVEVRKQCFHIIGPAGVGKTEICYQIADELTNELFQGPDGVEITDKGFEQRQGHFQVIMVKAPVLSRDDFIIPFPVIDNGSASFKMLYSDFVPKDKDSYGLFVIDEFSRGDHSLQQLLWQVQNEYKIHLMDFPKGWFVISIDNPDDSEYQIDTMEDAAGLRRQLHVYSEVSVPDFLNYAVERKFHETIIEFISTHPDYLYDFDAQKIGSVYANPASYEKLSDHMKKMDIEAKGNYSNSNYEQIRALSSGLLNTAKANLFIEFLREGSDINPKDIFSDYKRIRLRIKKMLKENDNAGIGNVTTSFLTYLTTSRPKFETREAQNVAKFLCDIPLDSAAIFVTGIDTYDRGSKEFKYITSLHVEMMKIPVYKQMFYETVVKAGHAA